MKYLVVSPELGAVVFDSFQEAKESATRLVEEEGVEVNEIEVYQISKTYEVKPSLNLVGEEL